MTSLLPDSDAPLQILKESSELCVAYKKAGQHCHPQSTDERGTLLNALIARFPETSNPLRPDRPLEGSLLHRIDQGTSGIVVAARTPQAGEALLKLWATAGIEKVYLAWLAGPLSKPIKVSIVLEHDPKSNKRMKASLADKKNEPNAISEFYPILSTVLKGALVLVRIETGKMHQIRATAAALGSPVLGDPVYSKAKPLGGIRFQTISAKSLAIFEKLKAKVPAPKPPNPANLPADAFFLHAAWLRCAQNKTLTEGIWAEPPEYF